MRKKKSFETDEFYFQKPEKERVLILLHRIKDINEIQKINQTTTPLMQI